MHRLLFASLIAALATSAALAQGPRPAPTEPAVRITDANDRTISLSYPELQQRLLRPKPLGALAVTLVIVIGLLMWGAHAGGSRTVEIALQPREDLLWAGTPNPGLRVLRHLPAIFFGLLFALVGLAFLLLGLAMEVYDVLSFSIVFTLIGMAFGLGPMIADARDRARLGYAVTSKRLVITEGGAGTRERSIPLENVRDAVVMSSWNDNGTIVFVLAGPGTLVRHKQGKRIPETVSFTSVTGVTGVREIVLRAREDALNDKSRIVGST